MAEKLLPDASCSIFIKIYSLHQSVLLLASFWHVFLIACVVCSVALVILSKGNWTITTVLISDLVHYCMCLCLYSAFILQKYYGDISLCWGTSTR